MEESDWHVLWGWREQIRRGRTLQPSGYFPPFAGCDVGGAFLVVTAFHAAHSCAMNEAIPIKNVRPVKILLADAPAGFSEMA
jgi:hypothetical protein